MTPHVNTVTSKGQINFTLPGNISSKLSQGLPANYVKHIMDIE
jgi:hypothetical protein